MGGPLCSFLWCGMWGIWISGAGCGEWRLGGLWVYMEGGWAAGKDLPIPGACRGGGVCVGHLILGWMAA